METVQLGDGRQATYHLFGSGDPLLFFVGGPGFPGMLSLADAEVFQDFFTVHLIDPHGSGGSTPPADPNDYSPLGTARFYDEVRQALGFDRVAVAGHSFGGTTAITYAATFSDVVDRCVCVNGLATGETVQDEKAAAEFERGLVRFANEDWYAEARLVMDEWTERILATDEPGEADRMMRLVYPFYLAEPDRPGVRAWIERIDPYIVSDLAAAKAWESGMWQTVDVRPLLGSIRCSTLVVCGQLDFICGPAHGRVLAEGIAGAELVTIPGCGHEPSMEAPEEFRAALGDWLARTAAPEPA
jgi:pimeloyl-ACP methyl ester carboxylesterase